MRTSLINNGKENMLIRRRRFTRCLFNSIISWETNKSKDVEVAYYKAKWIMRSYRPDLTNRPPVRAK